MSDYHSKKCECADCTEPTVLCDCCNGSGEGIADGTICSMCHGSGVEDNSNEPQMLADEMFAIYENADDERSGMEAVIEAVRVHFEIEQLESARRHLHDAHRTIERQRLMIEALEVRK